MTPRLSQTTRTKLARCADLLTTPILSREPLPVGARVAGLLARLGVSLLEGARSVGAGLLGRALETGKRLMDLAGEAWTCVVERAPAAPSTLAAGALALTLAPATGCEREWAGDCKGWYWKCALEVGEDPDGDGITPDDDCEEGNPDVGALFVGRDRDGDGIASMEDYKVAPGCEVPDGFSDIFEDCDDSDPDKADIQPWVEDLDGDGYGTGEPEDLCASEDGYALVGGDCDDTDASVHPEAAEVAEDGVDNDCDGRADDEAPEGSYTTSDATVTLDGAGDDDEFSYSFDAISDFDGQGGMDLAVGSPGAENSDGEAVGAVDILAGPISGASDLEDQDFTRLWGANEGDRAGAAVAGLGDVDGDGFADFIVGAPGVESASGWGGMDGASGPEGAAYVVYGPIEPGSTLMLEDSRHVAILGGGESAGRLGMAVAGIGDLTGDGLPDFAVGAPYTGSGGRWSDQPTQAGTVYLLSDLPDDEQEVGDVAFASLEGEEEYGWLGATVAGGKDLNGEGTPDLVVGAPTDRISKLEEEASSAESGGVAWILLDPPSGVSAISPWATTWVTGPLTSGLASSLSLIDDIDGDGVADLALSAPLDDGAEEDGGAIYLLSGAALEGLEPSEVMDSGALIGVVTGLAAESNLGWAVADAGDIDEDGRADLLVGAPGSDNEKGAVWLLTGAADGDQLGDAFLSIESPVPWGWAGRSLGVADLNGLGRPDLLLGAVEHVDDGKATAMPGHLTLFLTDGL